MQKKENFFNRFKKSMGDAIIDLAEAIKNDRKKKEEESKTYSNMDIETEKQFDKMFDKFSSFMDKMEKQMNSFSKKMDEMSKKFWKK